MAHSCNGHVEQKGRASIFRDIRYARPTQQATQSGSLTQLFHFIRFPHIARVLITF